MHIITGFIIAMLAKKVKKNKGVKGVPKLKTGPVRIAHAVPGRLRFMVPDLRGCRPSDLKTLERITRLPGVTKVTANSISGSIVVYYSHGTIEPAMVLMGLAKILGVEDKILQTPDPYLLSWLKNAGASLNRAVYEEAHGWIDLRSFLVLSLLLFGGLKVWRDRRAAFPAGITMLWWALNTIRSGKGTGADYK